MLPTAKQLVAAGVCTPPAAARFEGPLQETCRVYEIDTGKRIAAFVAQTGHESIGFSRLVEGLSYSHERLREVVLEAKPGSRWRSLLPRIAQLARNPEALGNAAYGGRMGNGPEATGDGYRYRGRGIIQNTGKANYEAITELLAKKLGGVPDLVLHPEQLESPRWACLAAGAFWDDHELNDLADRGQITAISKIVNGGEHGLADRKERYSRAMRVFGE
jgi:putative chitinase